MSTGSTNHVSDSPPSEDGRERFGRNVAFAWGGHMVSAITGFVVPRMISDGLGQVALGVWDFAWSFVAYFGLVQLGMGGSISRYVALYRARNDIPGMNRSVSTIAVFQRSVGWLAFAGGVAVALWVLPLFSVKLGDSLGTARYVVMILGAEVAITVSLSAYRSVIVGCHRWDLHNTVTGVSYGLVAIGMISAMLCGGGLVALASVNCVIMVGAEVVRWRLAYRVCPVLRIDRDLTSWNDFKEQARYSIKTMTPSISSLLSDQALSLLITAFLGPARLAVFSRSRSLMYMLRTLAAKFGMIVVPTASALHAKDDRQALRTTLLTTPAIISSLLLPVLVTMGVFGELVIRLWMGAAYVEDGLLAILCVGTYATLVQEPVWSLLAGMNIHGQVAFAKLGASAASTVLLGIGLWYFEWGLLGAAGCFALPQLLADGIITPWYACRVVGVSMRRFLWYVLGRPVLCVLPLGVTLVVASSTLKADPAPAICLASLGFVVTSVCYLKWLIPARVRYQIVNRIRLMISRLAVRTSH